MKKIKYLSLIAIILISLTGCGENKEELKQQEEINSRYIKIAEKINSIINDKIKPIEEVINKDIGEDTTKINELKKKKEEISKYLITINDKKITDLKKLKEENKKIENLLKNIDENLINLKVEEIENYTINEEHQINIISKEITKLIEEVNTLAIKQAEEKAKEELKQKILSGNLSSFEGKYKFANITLTIKNDKIIKSIDNYDGRTIEETYETSKMKITQEKDGSYKLVYAPSSDADYEGRFTISKDGKSVEQCELLSCPRFLKIN